MTVIRLLSLRAVLDDFFSRKSRQLFCLLWKVIFSLELLTDDCHDSNHKKNCPPLMTPLMTTVFLAVSLFEKSLEKEAFVVRVFGILSQSTFSGSCDTNERRRVLMNSRQYAFAVYFATRLARETTLHLRVALTRMIKEVHHLRDQMH